MTQENRGAHFLSWTGVGLSAFGAISNEQILAVAGPLLTLAVHFWTDRQAKGGRHKTELDYWRGRALGLDGRMDQLAAENQQLKAALKAAALPAAVVPPFVAAAAVSDCPTD